MIKFENVTFGYTPRVPLVKNLNMTLETGHIYGLLGRNGAGKTTLLKLIAGMRFAQSGTVDVLGFPAHLRCPSMLQELFYLGEDVWAPALSIADFTRIYSALYPAFDPEAMQRYLADFEMEGVSQKITQMSYGQKKKVMISFALATNVKILLMDEPTNGLDIPSKSQFRKVMAQSANEERIFLISTHQVRDLHSLIDSVLIVDKGEIVVNATTDEITDKLLFQCVDDAASVSDAIYTEDTLRGVYVVSRNRNGYPSKLDLELFFNAVMAEKRSIQSVFAEQNADI